MIIILHKLFHQYTALYSVCKAFLSSPKVWKENKHIHNRNRKEQIEIHYADIQGGSVRKIKKKRTQWQAVWGRVHSSRIWLPKLLLLCLVSALTYMGFNDKVSYLSWCSLRLDNASIPCKYEYTISKSYKNKENIFSILSLVQAVKILVLKAFKALLAGVVGTLPGG